MKLHKNSEEREAGARASSSSWQGGKRIGIRFGVSYTPAAKEGDPTWGVSFAKIDAPVLGYVVAPSAEDAVAYMSQCPEVCEQPLKAWLLNTNTWWAHNLR
jgi:hypothetical protein